MSPSLNLPLSILYSNFFLSLASSLSICPLNLYFNSDRIASFSLPPQQDLKIKNVKSYTFSFKCHRCGIILYYAIKPKIRKDKQTFTICFVPIDCPLQMSNYYKSMNEVNSWTRSYSNTRFVSPLYADEPLWIFLSAQWYHWLKIFLRFFRLCILLCMSYGENSTHSNIKIF